MTLVKASSRRRANSKANVKWLWIALIYNVLLNLSDVVLCHVHRSISVVRSLIGIQLTLQDYCVIFESRTIQH